MTICVAATDEELTDIAPVLLQLRPQYSKESLIKQIKKQQENGFNIAYHVLDGQVSCVAGFVISEKLAWEKNLYVDDLVTENSLRSKGSGKAMIDWLKNHAREQGCTQLHLDSGMQRKDAHRFYDREGFDRSSLHFSIAPLGTSLNVD